VSFRIDGKEVSKLVHRLVAQTFLPNPKSLPQVNHKDCDRANNNVDNLEWCTREDNIAYRDKCGHTAKNNAPKLPVLAINLATLEVSRFQSRAEASRALRTDQSSIGRVIKGIQKQAGGYWFTNADDEAVMIVRNELKILEDKK